MTVHVFIPLFSNHLTCAVLNCIGFWCFYHLLPKSILNEPSDLFQSKIKQLWKGCSRSHSAGTLHSCPQARELGA